MLCCNSSARLYIYLFACLTITSQVIGISEAIPVSKSNSTAERSIMKNKINHYMIETDDLKLEPPYEPSVNPFLFHLEHGSRLRPTRHHKKKPLHLEQQHPKPGTGTHSEIDSGFLNEELPSDPSRPHFADSNENLDDENKVFGDEEKNLRDLFNVLFSSDY